MSEKRKNIVYHITKVLKNGDSKTDNYENEKDFHKALKKDKKAINNVTVSIDNEDKEIPVYFIRSKAVFSDGENTLCIDNKGKLQKENKYEILKDKDGKDKYIVKKDENSYYRYSIDGHLIDSIKNKEKNSYTYYAYKNDSKEKVETKISVKDTEGIDKAIELSRGQIKVTEKGLEDEYKIEEQLFNITNIYPDGNTFVKKNDFFIRQGEFIKNLCIKNDIIKSDDKNYYSIDTLIVKLSSKLVNKEEKNLKLTDLSKAKSYILKELFEAYNYKVFALDARGKIIEEITEKSIDDIQKKYGKKVQFAFFDNNNQDLFLDTAANSMKFFDATNLAGVNGKGKSAKITKNKKVLEDGVHFFVKPVDQPMYFFKKEQNGEFSNHSNFKLKKGESRKVETSGSMTIKNSKIHNISNSSGHFKQSFESIMTGLAYLASQTEDCNIENLLDPDCRMKDGSYNILTDINEALKYREEKKKKGIDIDLDKAILDVAKPLTRKQIIAINMKAARMKAKESSKGRSIC